MSGVSVPGLSGLRDHAGLRASWAALGQPKTAFERHAGGDVQGAAVKAQVIGLLGGALVLTACEGSSTPHATGLNARRTAAVSAPPTKCCVPPPSPHLKLTIAPIAGPVGT